MKKIAILGLHLNFGGVEQAIINQANMLCDSYEVSLVISYKMSEKPAFYVNPKVKIVYLMDLIPNKDEIKQAIKSFNIIKIIKEGFKSIKVLYLKRHTMIKYIKHSQDDILISSRISFTKLLNKYGKNKVKIAEEHRHHNNDQKYINSLVKACSNIDYLVCVSKELTNFYKGLLKNTKCIYIPNGLDYFPSSVSKLNNKDLISVGRLSVEKGYSDLIDVFKLIYDVDKKFHLDIIGDGDEYGIISEKIKKYKLENSVTLHGFQNKEYINKLLEKSSLYLMCSFEESFGIVLIEAASFGVPQIAFSSAQGAKEIISNNKSGFLIENRNKEEMAKKVVELINNKDKLTSFGVESRKIAKIYSFDEVKKEWNNFINVI